MIPFRSFSFFIGSGETWAVFFTFVSDTIELHVLSVFTLDNISIYAEVDYIVDMISNFLGKSSLGFLETILLTLDDECIV